LLARVLAGVNDDAENHGVCGGRSVLDAEFAGGVGGVPGEVSLLDGG